MSGDAEDQPASGVRSRSVHARPQTGNENRRRRRAKLARRREPEVDDDERRYARRMKAFVWFVFVGCFVSALAGYFAKAAGRADLESACGLLAIFLIGQSFFWSIIASARHYGYSWIAGLGMVTKQSHPAAYWSMAAIPLLLGAGLTIGVIVAAWRRWMT